MRSSEKPEIFTVLRNVIDERKRPGQFLILGSASVTCCGKVPRAWLDALLILSWHPSAWVKFQILN